MYVLHFNHFTYIGLAPIVYTCSSLTVTVNCLSQNQQSTVVVSQPSSHVTIVSDTHTIISPTPVTTVSVVECVTTSSSVVTGISGPTITTTSCVLIIFYYVCRIFT